MGSVTLREIADRRSISRGQLAMLVQSRLCAGIRVSRSSLTTEPSAGAGVPR